jgi:hypothetical protein
VLELLLDPLPAAGAGAVNGYAGGLRPIPGCLFLTPAMLAVVPSARFRGGARGQYDEFVDSFEAFVISVSFLTSLPLDPAIVFIFT